MKKFSLNSNIIKVAMQMKLSPNRPQYNTLSIQGRFALFTNTCYCLAIPHLNKGLEPIQDEGININLDFKKAASAVLKNTTGYLKIEHIKETATIKTNDDIQVIQKNLNINAPVYSYIIDEAESFINTNNQAENSFTNINTSLIAELTNYIKTLTGSKSWITKIKCKGSEQPLYFSFDLPEEDYFFTDEEGNKMDSATDDERTCYFVLMPMRS